jgi:hypothetical protein
VNFADSDTVLSIAMAQNAETSAGLSIQIDSCRDLLKRDPAPSQRGHLETAFQFVD